MNGYFIAYCASLSLGMSICLTYAWIVLTKHQPEPSFKLYSPDQLNYSRYRILECDHAYHEGKPALLTTIVESEDYGIGRIMMELTQVWGTEGISAKPVAPPWESISVSREGHSGTYEFFFSHGTLEKVCHNGVTLPTIGLTAREMAGKALQATRYLASIG